jgi:hypothetical protein
MTYVITIFIVGFSVLRGHDIEANDIFIIIVAPVVFPILAFFMAKTAIDYIVDVLD